MKPFNRVRTSIPLWTLVTMVVTGIAATTDSLQGQSPDADAETTPEVEASPNRAPRASELTDSAGSAAGITVRLEDFELLMKRNIFDPNRTGRPRRAATPRPRPPEPEVFSLTGTMVYEDKAFAFFSGTSLNFRTTLQTNGVIAKHRILSIGTDVIELEGPDQQRIELAVGANMRRLGDGPWILNATGTGYRAAFDNTRAASSFPAPESSPDAASAPDGAAPSAAERLRALMEARRAELNQ